MSATPHLTCSTNGGVTPDRPGWTSGPQGYESVDQLRGSMSQQSITRTTALVRRNYIKVLESYKPQTS